MVKSKAPCSLIALHQERDFNWINMHVAGSARIKRGKL